VTTADQTFLTNLCTLLEGCCITNGVRTTPDIAGCKAQAESNGFSRDPVLQSACLTELQGRAADGQACFPDTSNLADPCVRVYYEPAGSHQPGEPCTVRADCAGVPGMITSCVVGMCIQMAPGKAGDATCLGDVHTDGVIVAAPQLQATPPPIVAGVVCEAGAGLYCKIVDGDKTLQSCQLLGAGGDPCHYTSDCASGGCLGTFQSDGSLNGTCTSIVSAGQTCADATQAVCDSASYCQFPSDSVSGVCAAKVPAGGACNGDTMCESDTCSNTSGGAGTCAAVVGIGVIAYCGRL
jgi:hypothetical protein